MSLKSASTRYVKRAITNIVMYLGTTELTGVGIG